ncbi:MAG: hypothetical protein AAF702_12640 [Chloroflexota bacterium]
MRFGIVIFFIFFVVFLLIFSLITGIAWIMARLLMLIFPLNLFQAMLLSTIFSSGAGFSVYRLFIVFADAEEMMSVIEENSQKGARTVPVPQLSKPSDDEYDVISSKQFYKKASERTWKKWLTEEIANDIYAEFQDNPQTVSNLNQSQIEGLSIRLAEVGIEIITGKTSRARNLKASKNAFVKQAEKADQMPDNDEILGMAVDAYNLNMDYYKDELLEVIRDKKWNKLSTIKE